MHRTPLAPPNAPAGADGAVVDVASPGDVPAYGRRRSSSAGTASGQEEGEELSYDSYDSESDDEPGSGIFDLRKLQSALSENINKGYLVRLVQRSVAPPWPLRCT